MREIEIDRPFQTSLICMFSQRTNGGKRKGPFLTAARALVLDGVRRRERGRNKEREAERSKEENWYIDSKIHQFCETKAAKIYVPD